MQAGAGRSGADRWTICRGIEERKAATGPEIRIEQAGDSGLADGDTRLKADSDGSILNRNNGVLPCWVA